MTGNLFSMALAVLTALETSPNTLPRSVATPTWSTDVAPILYKHCVPCHRPGEVGPFSLISYNDSKKRSRFINELVATNRMPPWKPELGHASFKDEMRLSDKEKETLALWVAGGAPEGDTKDLPVLPPKANGWKLGNPDLVITLPKPFDIPGEGKDI